MNRLKKVIDTLLRALSQREAQWIVTYSHELRCFRCCELSLELHTNAKRLEQVIQGARKVMPDWIPMGVFTTQMEATLFMGELWIALDNTFSMVEGKAEELHAA